MVNVSRVPYLQLIDVVKQYTCTRTAVGLIRNEWCCSINQRWMTDVKVDVALHKAHLDYRALRLTIGDRTIVPGTAYRDIWSLKSEVHPVWREPESHVHGPRCLSGKCNAEEKTRCRPMPIETATDSVYFKFWKSSCLFFTFWHHFRRSISREWDILFFRSISSSLRELSIA